MTAKQDDLDSPLTRHIRSAMRAIDTIAAKHELTPEERTAALLRIGDYVTTAQKRMWNAWVNERE